MELKWASKVISDIALLYEFMTTVNRPAATHIAD